MAQRAKIVCPQCGMLMNFHAEKMDYSGGTSNAESERPAGGVLEEFHTCPNPKCRFIVEQPEVPVPPD